MYLCNGPILVKERLYDHLDYLPYTLDGTLHLCGNITGVKEIEEREPPTFAHLTFVASSESISYSVMLSDRLQFRLKSAILIRGEGTPCRR